MRIPDTVLREVAHREALPCEQITNATQQGHVVVLGWKRQGIAVAFGSGTKPKFDVIVGLSSANLDVTAVVEKAKIAASLGASAIHDGSPIGDVEELKRRLLGEVPIPIGLCHPLRASARCQESGGSLSKLKSRDFIDHFQADARSGADFLLAPYALTRSALLGSNCRSRIMLSPNKTGSMVVAWMLRHGAENPYYEHIDEVLSIAAEEGVALSIVPAFRAGALHDACDAFQEAELQTMADVVVRARHRGVPITVGTGGHLPLNKVRPWTERQKQLLNVPLIAFGPTPTDIGAGYDHVVAAVGQAFALMAGADAVVAITAAEHLALPTVEETAEECHIARLVCHMVSVARGLGGEALDEQMSRAREALDWEAQFAMSPDPQRTRSIRSRYEVGPGCSMCGTACAYPTIRQASRFLAVSSPGSERSVNSSAGQHASQTEPSS